MQHIAVLNWLDPWSHASGGSGGAERQLAEIFTYAAFQGHRITFFTSAVGTPVESGRPSGIDVIRSGSWHTANFAVPRALRRFCRNNRVDVVVEFISKVPFFAGLYVDKPIVCMVPHLFRRHVYREVNPLAGMYVNFMERLIPHVCKNSIFIAVFDSTRRDLIDLGIPGDQVKVVHNGVDHDIYKPSDTPRSESPLVLHVGRLKRYKCVDHIIMAMQRVRHRLPQAELMILGDGSDLPRLRRLVIKLGLERTVKFGGHVSESEKIAHLQRAHVFVNTSSKEGWGLNNIEANACGLPVIAYDSYGLRDSVNSRSGSLVPFGNIEALAEKILLFLTDHQLNLHTSKTAIEWANKFSWSRCARETLDIINSAT